MCQRFRGLIPSILFMSNTVTLPLFPFSAHRGSIKKMEVTHDKKFLVTLEVSPYYHTKRRTNLIRFWNCENYELTYVIRTNATSFNLHSQYLLTSTDTGISARELYTFNVLWSIELENPIFRIPRKLPMDSDYFFVSALCISNIEELDHLNANLQDDSVPVLIRIGLEDGEIMQIYFNTEEVTKRRRRVGNEILNRVWISDDGTLVHWCTKRTAYTWDLQSGQIIESVTVPYSHRYTSSDISSEIHPNISPWKFSPPKIMDYSKINDIRVRNKKRGKERDYYFTEDGRSLFLCIDNKIEIWDLFNAKEVASFGSCWKFIVSEDLGLVFDEYGGIIDVWDLKTQDRVHRINRNKQGIGPHESDPWGFSGHPAWYFSLSNDRRYLKLERSTIGETEVEIIYEVSTGEVVEMENRSIEWKTTYAGEEYMADDLTCYVLGETVILEFPKTTQNKYLQKFASLDHKWLLVKNNVFQFKTP